MTSGIAEILCIKFINYLITVDILFEAELKLFFGCIRETEVINVLGKFLFL